jgi:signal transduction histidine kinase
MSPTAPVLNTTSRSVESLAGAYHCGDVSRTKRVLAVSVLIPSEAYLASELLGSTGSFLWRVATDEILLSEGLYRLLAIDPSARVTLTRIGARLHPEDRPSLGLVLERARRGESEIDHDCRLRMPDRSIRWLRLVARGHRDGNGHVEYIGAVQDVTQLVLSRAELGEARSQLAQLARAVGLGPVAAAIAHEISQPLSGIVINASAGLRMLNAAPPDVEGARETMYFVCTHVPASVAWARGRLAQLQGDLPATRDLLERALAQEEEVGAVGLAERTRRDLAAVA